MRTAQRQKASAKLRRLSAYDRARGSVESQTSGSAALSAAALATAAMEQNQKEYFSGDRFQHDRAPNGEWLSRYRQSGGSSVFEWRLENKMRTVACALCMCLNIGTDPPGVDRPFPCATLECWIDPAALQPPAKSLELIGNTLQSQYMRLQPKAKFEQLLDPTSGAVKRMAIALRRHSKNERILFHYNGHGVPKPTPNGEVWVFDKSYTLYVPLSIDDLLGWLGGPTILVLDCNGAGQLLERFTDVVRQKSDERSRLAMVDPERAGLMPDYAESVLLGACGPTQTLPISNPNMPMDLFTACLTSPLKMGLKFFAEASIFGASQLSQYLNADLGEELLDKIPGKVSDRKTPLGELNWIYTAITDTIAWNILPKSLFQKLFRQDMLLASLLRNYLLATRIMAHFGCTTFSVPALPHASLIAKHPMWASWDLCLEQYLLSLDKYLNFARNQHQRNAAAAIMAAASSSALAEANGGAAGAAAAGGVGVAPSAAAAAAATAAAAAAAAQPPKFAREHINFFSEHLTAFEVWLEVGCESSGPPIQLPIVLQVLLSQVHRRRALILLARFLGKGAWAVNQALAVGIFPYVLKLLQSPDVPLREVLIFIWTKLLALDRSCQVDIIRERHESYFVNHLAAPGPPPAGGGAHPNNGPPQPQPHAVTERQRVMSAFVLSALCDGYPMGQRAVLATGVLSVLAAHLDSDSPSLRKWMCLVLGKVWVGLEDAKSQAISLGIPEKLCAVIADPVPEVRAAALYALGTFMSASSPQLNGQQGQGGVGGGGGGQSGYGGATTPPGSFFTAEGLRERHGIELMLAKNFSQLVVDASPLVREELVIALAHLVEAQRDEFVTLAHDRIHGDDVNNNGGGGNGGGGGGSGASSGHGSSYGSSAFSSSSAAMGVPPSPSQYGGSAMATPGLYAYPHPSPAGGGGGGGVASSPHTTGSYASSPQLPPRPSAATASAAASGSAAGGGSMGQANLSRTLSEPHPSSSPPVPSSSPSGSQQQQNQNLVISLSPNSTTAVPGGAVVTPLSPLQLHGTTPNPSAAAAQQQQGRPSVPLVRAQSVGHSGGGFNSVAPADAALYQQRLLIWRVVRTLSHDPFPSVSRAAIALRKLVVSRAFVSPPMPYPHLAHSSSSIGLGGYHHPGQQHQQGSFVNSSSLQSSPLMQNSALIAVPEYEPHMRGGAFLNDPNFQQHQQQQQQSHHLQQPAHARGRSDGGGGGMQLDQVSTRPRSRPVSEIDGGHGGGGGGGGGAGTLAPPTASSSGTSTRAPSPNPRSSTGSSGPSDRGTSSPSSHSSPMHHAQPTPSNAAGARRGVMVPSASSSSSAASGGGHRLVAAFDDARFDSGGSMFLSSTLPAPTPPSTIYARAVEYFVAPVGTVSSAGNHPAAHEANESPEKILEIMLTNDWRRKRNQDLVHHAEGVRKDCYDVTDRGTFEQVAALATGFDQVSALLFHPFETMLCVAEKRSIGIWDVKEFERINIFSNENARGTKISALSWINEQQQSLLLAGSDDGVVRLWKNVHLKDTAPEIVSAWLAVRSMPRGGGVGLVLDWQQETGHLLAAGPVDSIRVWDVEREICVLDLPVDSESYVSSVCSMAEGGVVFAGCGDGMVRMFDLRADNHTIHTVSRHPGSVVNVRVQRWGWEYDGDLISGGVNGDIHISDTRMLGGHAAFPAHYTGSPHATSVVKTMAAFDKVGLPLDALAVHDHAPLFAAGSRKQVVRVADFKGGGGGTTMPVGASGMVVGSGVLGGGGGMSSGSGSNNGMGVTGISSSVPMPSSSGSLNLQNGNTVSTLKYHKGFMGHRIGPVTAVAFHPHKLLLGVGSLNPLVSIMAAFPPSSL